MPAPLQVLSQSEATALLTASRGPPRLMCALALMGLSADEALALRSTDVDPEARQLQVGGAWARRVPMPAWLPDALPVGGAGDFTLLHDAAGQALTAADLASMIVGAALDAQLPQASGIGWDTLRLTAVDWLIGEGLRYSELPRVVGRIDAQTLQSLAARHGDAERRDLGEVRLLMPALQLDPNG